MDPKDALSGLPEAVLAFGPDLDHATKPPTLVAALAVLGRRLGVGVEEKRLAA
ncbi:MAG: hypothetical protein U1E62_24750 [Alsobacter sp.]